MQVMRPCAMQAMRPRASHLKSLKKLMGGASSPFTPAASSLGPPATPSSPSEAEEEGLHEPSRGAEAGCTEVFFELGATR